MKRRTVAGKSNHIEDLAGPLLIEEFTAAGHSFEAWRVPIDMLPQWEEMKGLENPVPAKEPFATKFWPCVVYPGDLASSEKQQTEEELDA